MSLFQTFGHEHTPEVEELKQEFTNAAEPFKGLESDYKQMQYFAKSGTFIQPIEELLPGVSFVQQTDSATGIVKQVAVPDTFQRSWHVGKHAIMAAEKQRSTSGCL